jgi:lysophospholipase L1-like esterase
VLTVKRILVLLLSILFTLLAAETALRLLAPFQDYTLETIRCFPDQYHPLYGYAGIPRLDAMFILPDFKHRIVNNSRGFRDRERSFEKGGEKRIVVLGDSTAWGWGVEAEERFSDVMERRLKGWEVINLAQAGYSTDQELLVLQEEGLKYHPDIVLLLFDRNDVVEGNNARQIDGIQPKPYFTMENDWLVLRSTPVPYDPWYWTKKGAQARCYGLPGGPPDSFLSWGYWRQRVLPKSHLFNWLSFRLSHPAKRSAEKREERKVLEANMALTKELLRRLNTLCQENGTRFVIADVPSDYSPILADFCRRENIPYIDLTPALSGRLRPVVHRRVGHWNRYGHAVVAEAIVDFMERNGLIQ